MSLKNCIQSLQALLKDFDVEAVVEAAEEYQARGMDRQAAETQAVQDHLDELQRDRARIEKAIADAYAVESAAHEAATSPKNALPAPTDAQKEAGNYKVGRINVSGLALSIENPEGSTRSGVGADGKRWSTTLRSHYGYIAKVNGQTAPRGKDKDHIDVFIKPGTPTDYSGPVFVVDQKKPGNGHFDEVKVMLGWDSLDAAREGYLENYTPGWDGIRDITETTVDVLKAWLSGDTTQPFGAQVAPAADDLGTAPDAVAAETPAKIVDVGEKVGGARKDTATPTGPRSAKAAEEDGAESGWRRPFPEGAERKAINEAFDTFVSTLETRETERGVEIREEGGDYAVPTETVEFKRWFEGSKVVDENGRPLVVYHGTATIGEAIENFAPERGASFGGINQVGTWFSGSPDVAARYSEQFTPDGKGTTSGATYPAYVSIKRPWVLNGVEGFKEFVRIARHRSNGGKDIPALKEYFRNSGKDGIIIRGFDGDFGVKQDVYVAFRSEQIKSAIGNRGTFDPADPSIVRENRGNDDYTVSGKRNTYGIDPRQIDLFAPAQRDAHLAARKAVVSLGRGAPTVLGSRIAADFREQGRVDLIGQEVHSPADLAVLAQVYRDPRFETLRYIFTNDAGRVVYQTGVTSRLPGAAFAAPVSAQEARNAAAVQDRLVQILKDGKAAGGTQLWLLHNHPSGISAPSDADRFLTVRMGMEAMALDIKLQPHVIINHNEYSTISLDHKGSATLRTEPLEAQKTYDLGVPRIPHRLLGRKIMGPADVVALGKEMEADPDTVVIIGRGGRDGAVGLVATANAGDLDSARAAITLRRLAIANGVQELFAVNVPPRLKEAALFALNRRLLLDAVGQDGRSYMGAGLFDRRKGFELGRRMHATRVESESAPYDPTDREPFRLDVIDTTSGPMFVNDEITLFPAGTEGAGEWPGGAVYSVVDTETGKNIGAVVVGLENRTITTIYSIKAKTERTGMGSRVLRALTASNPQPIVIDNIMAPAKKFWDKAGIYDYDGINAKLDWQSLNDARRKASDLPGSVRQDDGNSDLSGDAGSPGRVEEKKAGYGVEARAQNSFVDAARARIEPWIDELRFQAQDKFHFLNKVQRAAAEEKGLAELPEREDAYLAELRYHGMAGAAIEDFQRTHVDPVLAAIKESGLPIPEIDTFLHARHAPEANAQLKKINPDRANNEALSGMSNEEAAAVMEGFRKAGKLPLLNEIGEWVDAITAMRRDLLVKSGLETQSLVNRWASTYKHYVPLHREGKGGALPRKGKGFDTRGKEKRRAGSTLAVEHVLAHVIAQHEATILRAEKAKVGRALLEFARANPDPDLFEVDKVEYRPSFDSEGLVTFRADPGFVMADNVLVVRENGVDHRITFNAANPYALKIAAAMKNLGAADAGAIVNILTKFTRYLAIVNTSANPEFLISNFARDIQTAGYNLSGTKADALKWKIFRDVGRAWAGIRAFQKGEKTPWAERFEEFRKAGAQTGWLEQYKDIGDREKALVQKIRDMGDDRLHAVKRGLDAVWKFIEHHNTAVENSIRLSTFVHAREAGMTEAQAARLAKELTVNFNRKGSMGQTLNALYLFFNAAVQGSVRIFQALATSPKVRKLAIGTIIGAALLDVWNRAQGDDDEPNPYDAEVMKHTKERNIVVMLGDGKYLKIPAPWGFNVLHVMGQTIGEALTKPNFKPTEAASRLAVATLNAFNPVGGSGSLLQMVSPTITDPFAQWGENEDWAGRPLRPDGNPFGVDKPESQKYWASVRPYSKWVSEQLNELTGGDEVRPGMIDISPEAIDLTIDTLTGGAGRFLADTLGAPWKAVRGDDVETHEVPVLRKIYGAPGMGQVTQDYYKNRDSVALLEAQLKHYASDRQKFNEVKSEYAAEFRVLPAMKMAEKHLRMLRKQKKSVADDPKRVKDVDAQMKRVMEKFNRTYSQAHR